MIDVTRLREIVQAMAGGDMSQIDPALTRADVGHMMLAALDELEVTRRPVAGRFDTAAAREELARIDAMWAHLDPVTEEDAFHAARALLDRALAAIDAGWPEPVAITDAVVEEAATRAWNVALPNGERDHVGYWHEQDALEHANRRNEARAVLEYAASLGLTSASAASRPFRPTAATSQSVMVSACYAAGFTEEQTIAKLVEHAGVLERDMRRLLEGQGVPMVVPVAPPAKPAADRLVDYRCALLQGYAGNRAKLIREWRMYDEREHPDFEAWLASEAEALAHAMLAAEKEPSNAR